MIAGDDDVALEQRRQPIAGFVKLGAERRATALHGLRHIVLRVDKTEFEGRYLAEQILDLGGVLHARQLHGDTIEALPLHDGLGDTEFVDAVTQRGEVLRDRVVLTFLDLRRSQHELDDRPRGSLEARDGQIGPQAAKHTAHLPDIGTRRQQYTQPVRPLAALGHADDVSERDVLL